MNYFKFTLLFLLSILVLDTFAQKKSDLVSVKSLFDQDEELIEWVSAKSYKYYGGFYLRFANIKKINPQYTYLKIAEIQNKMRDCLEARSRSVLPQKQANSLKTCLKKARQQANAVSKYESEFEPLRFHRNSQNFIVAIDMENTILSQWFESSFKYREVADFEVLRDEILNYADKRVLLSPKGVVLRPNLDGLFSSLAKVKGFQGFVIFSDKADNVSREIYQILIDKFPLLKEKSIGLFTRNHMRLDEMVEDSPAKDLSIIDETLKHVLIIDDDPSKVLQKELCFTMPKFNADLYLEMQGKTRKGMTYLKRKEILKANSVALSLPAGIYNLMLKESRKEIPAAFLGYSAKAAEKSGLDWGAYLLRQYILNEASYSAVFKYMERTEVFSPKFFSEVSKRAY